MKLMRTIGCGLGAVAFFLACSSDDVTTPKAGLNLTVSTDGSVTPDRVSVKVSSATSVFYESELALGASAQLPKTLTIGASGTATIVVQAWNGSTPLDRRDLSVATLPSDRFVSYSVVLGGKCTSHVRSSADGSITSDCAAGTTCDPTNGSCGSATPTPVDASCVAGTARCAADGISVETCAAAGSWAAATSCNGKTCANGACTACNVGDASCGGGSTTCTAGAKRCGVGDDGRALEQCAANGTWTQIDACVHLCRDGACIGECRPGSVDCCHDAVDENGNGKRVCDGAISTCVSGPGCNNGNPLTTKVYLTQCDADGQRQEINDCEVGGSTGNVGTNQEFRQVACGRCDATNSLSCLNVADPSGCISAK